MWLTISMSQSSIKGHQRGNSRGAWRQKLKQRTWSGAAYWLAPHGLLSLLFTQPRTTCLEVTPPTVGCALLHQSLIEGKSNLETRSQANVIGAISLQRFPLHRQLQFVSI